jgi:hypothetical protein
MATQLFGEAPTAPELTPCQFRIRAEYSWPDGQADETSPVDLRPYAKTTLQRDGIVEQLEAIRKELAKLSKK